MNSQVKLEWFGGNVDAANMCSMFIDLGHFWDDLVDKDKLENINEKTINNAFLTALVYLPTNPFYRAIQDQILPMWITVVSAYQTANAYEAAKDAHGIEIAHGLRYAIGHILSYAVYVCVGFDKAQDVLPELWKAIFFERFDDYRKEHL